ncbi:DUF2306 domain-containing protein [Pseudalkalibacillus sp. SCS-8]|uniref:DUF2306 domain-containing protein n=1 Tax=Pseudalkalibacillus nanhaiensis TaxID=3115291 RepID=UPI0032DB2116
MDYFLIVHIITGIICIIVGGLAAGVRKRKGKHTLYGEIYHGSYVLVFITAVVMSIWNWNESAYLFYIALFSYGLALMGYLARKRMWKNWMRMHIGGMLGSYIGIITATIVVNISKVPVLNELPVLIFWFLPTIIGTPIIAAVSRKYIPKKKKAGPDVVS